MILDKSKEILSLILKEYNIFIFLLYYKLIRPLFNGIQQYFIPLLIFKNL